MKYLAFISFIFLLACTKVQMDDCITSAGPYREESRDLSSFNRIYTEDKLEVILIQDSVEKVVIKGPRNLLGQITTEVNDGLLELKNSNTCNFVRSFDIRFSLEVHFKELDFLELNSASSIKSIGQLQLNDLYILHNALSELILNVNATGEIYVQSFNTAHTRLRGKARTLKGSIEEVSDIDAKGLVCEEVLLDHHSPLNSYIHATELVFARLYNDGNLYYISQPGAYIELNYRRAKGDLILY